MSKKLKKMNLKIIERKIKNKNYTTIKTNSAFTTFYNELKDYFTNHKLLGTSLEIINDRYFIFNNNVTKCEAILIYHPDICKIELLPTKDGTSVELYRLEMFKTGQGLGSTFMDIFKNISKKTNIEILLKPGVLGIGVDDMSDVEYDDHMKKVRNFYHKQGFKRKGLKTRFWSNVA